MDLPSCSSRPRPRLWLLRRNLAPAGEESLPVCACCHSVVEAPLPGGAGAGGCVSSGAALLSGGRGEESTPSEFGCSLSLLAGKLSLTGRNQPASSSHVNRNLNQLLTNALLLGSAAGRV